MYDLFNLFGHLSWLQAISIAENRQMAIIYDLINPKKNPNIESNVPRPVYLIALLMPLLISNIKNITIQKL